jgi:hypothetical protein
MTNPQKIQTKQNIRQKIHTVMKNAGYIKKKKSNMPYKSVTHNDVTDAIRNQFNKVGLIIIPSVKSSNRDGNIHSVTMSVKIIDVDSGESLEVGDYPGTGIDNQDKGFGKAVSYAFKYILQKLFLLEIGDDEEVDRNQVQAIDKATKAKAESDKIWIQYTTNYISSIVGIINNENKDFEEKKKELNDYVEIEAPKKSQLAKELPGAHDELDKRIAREKKRFKEMEVKNVKSDGN